MSGVSRHDGESLVNQQPHAIEIDCARRERGIVTHVGGPARDGRRWTAALEQVIAQLERNEVRYFISRGSQQFGLRVKDGELVTMVEDGWSVRSLPACLGAG
jgi:hypothetical protein